MTDPVVEPKKSILATLLADLEAIEQNFHNFADPQLAIATKMRELLTEAVAALETVRVDIEKAKAFGTTLEGVVSQVEDIAKRLAAIEPKDAGAKTPPPASS